MENASLFRGEPLDQSMLFVGGGSKAVVKGHIDVAETFLNLDANWIIKFNNCKRD
jgi:hypothetical protein